MSKLLATVFLLLASIVSAQVTGLAQDDTGNIWLAGNDRLIVLGTDSAPPKIIDQPATRVAAGIGSISVTTHDSLLTCNLQGCKKQIVLPEDMEVRALAVDKKNDLWIGTRKGLFKLKEIQSTIHRFIPDIVDAITFDEKDAIYIGSGHEVKRLQDGKSEVWNLPPPPPNVRMRPPITSILLSNNGKLYVGTHQGLLEQNGQSFRKISEDEVLALLEDRRGNFWMATSDELKRRKDGKWADVSLPLE